MPMRNIKQDRVHDDAGILTEIHHAYNGREDFFVDSSFVQILKVLQMGGGYRRIDVPT